MSPVAPKKKKKSEFIVFYLKEGKVDGIESGKNKV